ncbi:MAG: TetR/AcrR family transcriptional regulator, partial [Acidobacteriota bacterium]
MVQISSNLGRDTDSKGALKRIEILEAASRVFRDRGLHATGMRDIAAECGMQVGNLYYYFKSKQDLLAFCQSHTLDGLLQLSRRVAELDLRSDTRLYLIVLGHVMRLNQDTLGSLAHLEVEALDARLRRPILRRRDQYESSIRAVVKDGADRGVFRSTDPKVATMAVLGAVNWTVKWFHPGGGRTS